MQSALRPQAALQPRHPPAVGTVVVIVTDQVKQPVQRQHLEFLRVRMPRLARLPPGNAGGDDDVAQMRGVRRVVRMRGETEHVGWHVLAPELPIERLNAAIGDKRDGDAAARGGRRDSLEPRGQPWGAPRSALVIGYGDGQFRRASASCASRTYRSGTPRASSISRTRGTASTVWVHCRLRTPSRSAGRASAARRPGRRSERMRSPRRCRRPSSPR